jgi:bifunctional DNA-binding transcriptional regulator/antitoxin component of YhaV-PrlF toxin-antitoxin module
MPQIIKGGKHIFGWSKVNQQGRIMIPKEAMKEYNFFKGQKVFLILGSKKSGRFGITIYEKLNESKLNSLLKANPDLAQFKLERGKIKEIKGRAYCWEMIQNNTIKMSHNALKIFEINPGNFLLAIRGSNLSLGFISKGPIYEKAKNHAEIPTFKC